MSNAAPVTASLAAICRGIRYDELPPDAAAVARQCLLDWLGVTIAGAGEPLVQVLGKTVGAGGGQCSLIPTGRRLAPAAAALINGAAGHALDYDDVNTAMSGHPTVPVLPAVLALSEARDTGCAALMAAFVAGVEMECRAGRYVMPGHYARGFHATGTLGTFGAAAACCHLLGLAQEQWQYALGIAGSQASGLKSMFGTMTKPLQAGNAAANGLFAATLASNGFTSNPAVFETEQGFGATQTPALNAEAALADTGRLAILDTLFKYHAACYGTHATIEGVLRLREANHLAPADVASIALSVPPGNLAMCNIAEPTTGLEGKFSMRFAAAAALREGRASEATFTDAMVAQPELIALRDRVTVMPEPADPRATTVSITLRDGRQLSRRVDLSIPETDLDLQWERLTAKFIGLASPVLGPGRASELASDIRSLDPAMPVRSLVARAIAIPEGAPA